MLEIARIDSPLSYKDFYEKYLKLNVPCVLTRKFTSEWPCIADWVKDGQPSLKDVFKSTAEIKSLPVANCQEKEFGSHPKLDMTPAEYQVYWERHQLGVDDRLLYLKDWHFCWTYPAASVYQCHEYFSSDWMNEFWSFRRDVTDDFRFVYIGPSRTWTPFHADVYRSYSWSTNICGRKRWILFPPGEEEKLKNGNVLPFDVRNIDLNDIDHLDFVQEAGETIFVPSGWHHQVMNAADTISLNHNWINACAVKTAWTFLQTQLTEVEESIRDVEDTPGWKEQAQVLLRAYAGINFFEFMVMLKFILVQRLSRMMTADDLLVELYNCDRTSLMGINTGIDKVLAVLSDRKLDETASSLDDAWLCKFDVETCGKLLLEMEGDTDVKLVLAEMGVASRLTDYQRIVHFLEIPRTDGDRPND